MNVLKDRVYQEYYCRNNKAKSYNIKNKGTEDEKL
jgi:hypothetical protein